MNYKFNGITGIKIEKRILDIANQPILLPDSRLTDKKVANIDDFIGIGDFSGEFYLYDRDREVISKLGDRKLIEDFLDENGGIRIYRDNIRVYNYGEPGDDWLGLDLRRVNVPGKHVSRNIIVGYLDLDLENSNQLIEKTNREGFVENETYYRLKKIVLGILSTIEAERLKDKSRLRQATESIKNVEIKKIEKPLENLRKIAKKYNISDELEPIIKQTERYYNEMKDVMLTSGFNNMGLAIVFHEVEHGVRSLYQTIESSEDINLIKNHAYELVKILDSFSELLRKGEDKPFSMKKLIARTRDIVSVRLRKHKITFPFLRRKHTGY